MTTPADLRAAADRLRRVVKMYQSMTTAGGVSAFSFDDIASCADAALLLAEARESGFFARVAAHELVRPALSQEDRITIEQLAGGVSFLFGGPDA